MIKPSYGILMGDLVNSRDTLDVHKLHASFNYVIEQLNKEHSEIASPLTITLGDEFQGLVTTISKAFLLAFRARFMLLAQNVECRFVVGWGRIETPLNRKNSWNMMGEGLAEARQKLSDKDYRSYYHFSFPKNPDIELLLESVGRSLSKQEDRWTVKQKKYVAELVLNEHLSRSSLADELHISRNTLYTALKSADFDFHREQVQVLVRVLKRLDSLLIDGENE